MNIKNENKIVGFLEISCDYNIDTGFFDWSFSVDEKICHLVDEIMDSCIYVEETVLEPNIGLLLNKLSPL